MPFPRARRDRGEPVRLHERDGVAASRSGKHDGGVPRAQMVIPSSANYQRFCSSFLATKKHGFERDLLFTNEEATDFVYRTGTAWPLNEPADPRVPEQAGVVVAYDVESGAYKTDLRDGSTQSREQRRAALVRALAVLSGDDTFSAPARRSCTSTRRRALTRSGTTTGQLWAFVSDNSGGQRLRRPHRRRVVSRASSCPFRRRSPRASRRRSRTGRTRTTCSSSSASRTSPTTARSRAYVATRAIHAPTPAAARRLARGRAARPARSERADLAARAARIRTIRRRRPCRLLDARVTTGRVKTAGRDLHQPDNLETTAEGAC